MPRYQATDVLAGPQVAAVASASRGQSFDETKIVGTSLGVGLQASWAIDLWGGNRAGVAQADAQQTAALAGWHDARVLVASELAQTYFAQRLCQVQLRVAERDRDSRAVTAQAAGHTERAGLTAPAVAALAQASAADSVARARQQADACERQTKALVALTGLPEPEVRAALATVPDELHIGGRGKRAGRESRAHGHPASTARCGAAQANWVASAQGVGVARADMLPSLSFSGSWLRNQLLHGHLRHGFNTWSIGPFSMTVPVVGRGALQARTEAAEAQYKASGVAYAATLRQAIAEVEQALVGLDGLRQREQATATALAGYTQSFKATEARYKVGFASLNELEEARRLQLNAESATLALQQERINTWISLYVALGGGFDPETNLVCLQRTLMNAHTSNAKSPRMGKGWTWVAIGLTAVALVACQPKVDEGATDGTQTRRSRPPTAMANAVKPSMTVTVEKPSTEKVGLLLDANGNVSAWQEASVGAEVSGLAPGHGDRQRGRPGEERAGAGHLCHRHGRSRKLAGQGGGDAGRGQRRKRQGRCRPRTLHRRHRRALEIADRPVPDRRKSQQGPVGGRQGGLQRQPGSPGQHLGESAG